MHFAGAENKEKFNGDMELINASCFQNFAETLNAPCGFCLNIGGNCEWHLGLTL